MNSTTKRLLTAALMLAGLSFRAGAEENAAEKKPLPLMVPHKKFSQDCGQCHVPKRWDMMRADFRFNHMKETNFPLNGAHADAKCVQCHNDRGPAAVYAARGCGGCHPDPHKSGLGLDCARCHTEISWRPKNMIAEHARTAFPLTGSHLVTDCEKCHVRASVGDYRGATILCYACHQADHARAPNHLRFNFPRTCADCHNTSAFAGARFNHSFLSNVADCYTCHQVDYQRAPNHIAFNYPRTCGDCHNTTAFSTARFNHSFLSPTADCYSCHAKDYAGALNPNHVALHFSVLCYNCHLTTTFLTSPASQAPRPVSRR